MFHVKVAEGKKRLFFKTMFYFEKVMFSAFLFLCKGTSLKRYFNLPNKRGVEINKELGNF